MLWKTISSNKLLARVQIVSLTYETTAGSRILMPLKILFMNKTDLLRRKLDSGVQVRDHIPEFRDKANDYDTVTACEKISLSSSVCFLTICSGFKKLFKRLYYANTTPNREFFAHFTSVVVSVTYFLILGLPLQLHFS
jgi:guanine nucleotide-binding protein alpha-1 subunit